MIGGGEQSLLGLIQALHQTAVTPVLIIPGPGEIAEWGRRAGFPLYIIPMPSLKPFPRWRNVRSVGSLARILLRNRVNLVHANGSRAMLYAGLAARLLGIPVIWHVRIVDPDPWLDGILLRLATAVIVNSRATASRFAGRSSAGKVHVIPNGVDLDRFCPGLPPPDLRQVLGLAADGPVIAFAGRLEYGKGPDLFLEAALRVHRESPGVSFLVVGDGPMRSVLETKARAAGLPAVFVGHQPDLLPILRLCAAVVMPSRQEAFGRVLIEAMATEVPVVATRVGGIPEACQDGRTGLLVPSEDAAALAAAIVTTLNQPEAARIRVRAAAADVRARFSLPEHAGHVYQLYRSLLGGRPMHGSCD